MDNDTSVFLLLEFSKIWEIKMMYSTFFLLLYFMTITGNFLIISVVALDSHLHTPMYFFLMNLALQDVGSVSVIVPKAVFNLVMNIRDISYSGCVAQVLLFAFFMGCDIALLTVMAYDRFVAICNPLQYEIIMNKTFCIKMVGSAWLVSFIDAILNTIGTFTNHFCSNIVNQFYCEIPQLLKFACSDTYVIEIGYVIFLVIVVFGCFIFVTVTYAQIFSVVSRIPSVQGRKKAFSTCFPHLTVFSIFLVASSFGYLIPRPDKPSHFDFTLTISYSIIPPMLNPLIYSMRNKEIKVAISKMFALRIFGMCSAQPYCTQPKQGIRTPNNPPQSPGCPAPSFETTIWWQTQLEGPVAQLHLPGSWRAAGRWLRTQLSSGSWQAQQEALFLQLCQSVVLKTAGRRLRTQGSAGTRQAQPAASFAQAWLLKAPEVSGGLRMEMDDQEGQQKRREQVKDPSAQQ
ncbi:olfactory receptor 14I1-like [Vipera latastei]